MNIGRNREFVKILAKANHIKSVVYGQPTALRKCLWIYHFFLFFKLAFTPCKADQPLQGMELQEKEAQKD